MPEKILFRTAIWAVMAAALAVAQGPTSPDVTEKEVRNRIEAGDLAGAAQLATEGQKVWPRSAVFPHLHGIALFREGLLEAAAADLVHAQSLAPADTDITFDLGLVRMAQQRYDDAADAFTFAMKDPERAQTGIAHVLLGRAYLNSNRSESAVAEFKTALAVEPAVPLGHFHLGFAYESLGRDAEAASEYGKELARTRDNPEVYYQLGNVLTEMGEWAKAIESLEQALRLKPGHADAQYDLGKCLLLSGRTKEAVEALQKAVQLAPDSANAHYQIARALQKAGDTAAARQHMERFAELKKKVQETGGMATGRIK